MTPSMSREVSRLDRCGAGVCAALVVGQVFFLAHLLQLSLGESALLALLAGLPIALACYGLLLHASDKRWVRMSVVMFAAGGFGMLFGYRVDSGPLGLYGLLEVCRSWSADPFWPSPEQLWLKIGLMPWACVGMLVGGNVGMVTFDLLHRRRTRSVARAIGLYGVCNLGMLLGMAMTEHAVTFLTTGLSQITAGTLMMAAMLVGMTSGMGAALALAARLPGVGGVIGRET